MEEHERRKIDEQKKIFDAVTKEWLDEKFATFGKWTLKTLLAIIFVFFLKAILHLNSSDLRAALDTANVAHDLAK